MLITFELTMTYPRDAKETSVDKRMKKREDNPFLV
jgi:hypothetical protein